jgi:hypothetical protein
MGQGFLAWLVGGGGVEGSLGDSDSRSRSNGKVGRSSGEREGDREGELMTVGTVEVWDILDNSGVVEGMSALGPRSISGVSVLCLVFNTSNTKSKNSKGDKG